MRYLAAILLTALLFGSEGFAKQTNKPDIKLTAFIDTAAPEQQPILVVHFINQSGHALRIPDPPLLCKAAPGALSLIVKFIPENTSQSHPPADCGLQVDGSSLPDIRERAKNWLVLKAGQDYQVRRPLAMGVDTNAHGTYDLWVEYDGPAASDEDVQKLKDAAIEAPVGKFQSEKLTYKIDAPKE